MYQVGGATIGSKGKNFKSLDAAFKYAAKVGKHTVYRLNKDGMIVQYYSVPEKQSNPSILSKLRKGVRGHIKLSRGRLIIKT